MHRRRKNGFLTVSTFQTDKSDEEFWEYEWLKHGTCSVNIGELNSSAKYFLKALDWLKQYNMTEILAEYNIIPDNEKSYELLDIHKAVKSALNKNPYINCYIDSTTREQYLNEIRICFDHQLELIDCHGMYKRIRQNKVSTNCGNIPIHYLVDIVDPTSGWLVFFNSIVLIILGIFLLTPDIRQRFYRTNELKMKS